MTGKQQLDPREHPYRMLKNAESLQRLAIQVEFINECAPTTSQLYLGAFLASPILFALAIEIALKAWYCREGNTSICTEHNLLLLFQQLTPTNRSIIEAACPEYMLPGNIDPRFEQHTSIHRILEYHQDTFTRWRYVYETMADFAEPPAMNLALTAIIESFGPNPYSRSSETPNTSTPVLGNQRSPGI